MEILVGCPADITYNGKSARFAKLITTKNKKKKENLCAVLVCTYFCLKIDSHGGGGNRNKAFIIHIGYNGP